MKEPQSLLEDIWVSLLSLSQPFSKSTGTTSNSCQSSLGMGLQNMFQSTGPWGKAVAGHSWNANPLPAAGHDPDSSCARIPGASCTNLPPDHPGRMNRRQRNWDQAERGFSALITGAKLPTSRPPARQPRTPGRWTPSAPAGPRLPNPSTSTKQLSEPAREHSGQKQGNDLEGKACSSQDQFSPEPSSVGSLRKGPPSQLRSFCGCPFTLVTNPPRLPHRHRVVPNTEVTQGG